MSAQLISTSIMEDALSVVPISYPRKGRGARHKCRCCGGKETHQLFAGRVCMGFAGCEMSVWRSKREIEKRRGFK